jgi:uncharacterized protein with PQ loop repeat
VFQLQGQNKKDFFGQQRNLFLPNLPKIMETTFSQKIKIIIIILLALAIGIFLFFKIGSRSINITTGSQSGGQDNEHKPSGKMGVNPITGLECENYNRRPFAVMLAEDPITRPLSSITMADLVIEMPVVTGSITRLMAVYICESPEEIGSVRSARHDYIPIALGLDAVFAHWGGSHYALDKLDNGIMDNIDAMENPYNAFWQKSGIPMPHNGFTSMERLVNAAEKLGYRLETIFKGYPHLEESKVKSQKLKVNGKLTIGYPGHFAVYYEYNSETNSYLRWRAGTPEIDKWNNKQVEVSNVVIMKAGDRMIEPPNYNDVDVEGTGEAIVYRNGEEIIGTWKKEGSYKPTKLYFLDQKGKEIKFVPGKIWIEIVEPNTEIKWEIK